VATLVAPSTSPSGATMELPQPAHNRKPASTTLRNATGERALPTRAPAPSRWRAPAIVGGVALVAAISVLVILRGTGGGDRHDDAESTNAATQSSATSRPVIAAPDEPKIARPIARPPEMKPPSTEPTTTAVEPTRPLAPATRPVVETDDRGTGTRKANAKNTHGKGGVAKAGRPKKGGAAAEEAPPATATTPTTNGIQESSNKSPIIPAN